MSWFQKLSAALPLNILTALDFFSYAEASYIPLRPISQGPMTTPAPIVPRATESFTAVSECHMHGVSILCLYGTTELQVVVPATATSEIPPTYTGCHTHGGESFCLAPNGSDVEVLGLNSEDPANHSEEGDAHSESVGQTCHFHAGVEHCVGRSSESSVALCSRRDRDYNVPLRIALLFVILVTSFIGVAGPIFLKPILPQKFQPVFLILKQFGTGVIISTAFVHLFTHAELMFTNECLGELKYEATTAAIVMAGMFFAFVIENVSHRLAQRFWARTQYNGEVVGVAVLEAGIIFHSLLIGVTLVVAGDSFFVTLFVVILFHQMFEGIALGTRIASVGHFNRAEGENANHAQLIIDDTASTQVPIITDNGDSLQGNKNLNSLPISHKFLMAAAFALVTPVGMAIGIGVLNQFNGNDPRTLITLGTLNALSAGILIWVGVVEMWAGDWMFGGELADAGALITTLGGLGLVAGMALMGFLGKWA
ncbi:Zip-domain-containing protein [Daldinia decipiens]|uniref:Zip-domain-containing protein n=1 Tax=Daldinia decipiens TaxID=326647 RepID=UPI0020C59EAF|nr:Zip-domain-containing protein [Daldinia decipiens]KAI1653687.1 Zip-domain-containing protein [Daldinia decipiens]